jgi:hypothetical protein
MILVLGTTLNCLPLLELPPRDVVVPSRHVFRVAVLKGHTVQVGFHTSVQRLLLTVLVLTALLNLFTLSPSEHELPTTKVRRCQCVELSYLLDSKSRDISLTISFLLTSKNVEKSTPLVSHPAWDPKYCSSSLRARNISLSESPTSSSRPAFSPFRSLFSSKNPPSTICRSPTVEPPHPTIYTPHISKGGIPLENSTSQGVPYTIQHAVYNMSTLL